MDRTWIPGTFERPHCDICGKPGASCKADRRASAGRAYHFGFVPDWRELRGRGNANGRNSLHKILALLATLVSAPVFSFLLRRTSETGTPGESTMGGREAPRVRPMAHGCESFPLAGAVCASSAESIQSVGLFQVLSLLGGSRRDSLLLARFDELLG